MFANALRGAALALGAASGAAVKGRTPASTPLLAPPILGDIAPDAFHAFVALAGPVIDAARGRPTLADAASVANLILAAIETIDPAAIPIVALAEAAEPVAGAIFGFVKSGGVHISAGGRPPLGGFAGARGHI